LINTIVYVIFLVYHHIWGTFGLEVFVYLPANIAGWVVWAKHRDEVETEKTKAKKMTKKQLALSAIAVLVLGGLCFLLLNKLDGTTPLLDAFVVSMGIVATVLQFLRYREQYVWWLVQDVIAVVMYIVAFDPVYLTKKSIYLIMAVIGLYNWAKLQKTRNAKNI
jgi:nicotinamide mononucleotide transporter